MTPQDPVPPIALDRIPFLGSLPPFVITLVGIVVLLLVAFIAQQVTQRYLVTLMGRLTRRTRGSWDEALYERRVFHRLGRLVPLIVIQAGIALVPDVPVVVALVLERAAAGLMVVVMIRAIGAAVGTAGDIYERNPASRERPIKGYLQGLTLLVYLVGIILAIAVVMDRSPLLLLSGIGVLASVLMLVFRDTILSFVAGIQLTTNRLISVGDWISMPQFGADGDVVDIALNSVQVQNFDRTITAIPTHKFLDHSFVNWRGMQRSGGRRIMRNLVLDMSTIRFLTPEEVDHFGRYVLLRDYIAHKKRVLAQFAEEHVPDPGFIAEERRLTNVGTFRAYIEMYLRRHPGVHQEMTFLVRQLEPTSQGVALQVYVFANSTAWAVYEGIQADIFDHLLAVAGTFGLRVFQEPSGHDLAGLRAGEAPRNDTAEREARPA